MTLPEADLGRTNDTAKAVAWSAGNVSDQRHSAPDVESAKRQGGEAFGRLPLSFEPNEGHADQRVIFSARGDGYGLFLTAEEAVLLLRSHGEKIGGARAAGGVGNVNSAELRVRLSGGNTRAVVTGLDELPGRDNYFKNRDGGQRPFSVPTYARVRYAGVYPGVDLIYYGNQRQLEYDFRLAPGADPLGIRLTLAGAERLKIDRSGELVIRTTGGEVRQRKPEIYQELDGRRVEVAGGYRLTGRDEIGFTVGAYDPSRPLVIDPILVYSTYLGGKSSDTLNAIAVDPAGNVYVTGSTYSQDFPATPGALKATSVGINPNLALHDAFVTKLNAAGNAAVYSTFLGGNKGNDDGTGIAVDASGNAYVVGTTYSTDFPVTPGAFQTAWGGGTGTEMSDAFVAKLNATGDALIYSTYLGGNGIDLAAGVAIDGDGDAYVAGATDSANFPVTAGAAQQSKSNSKDAFITKLNPTGTALVYSTFLGGGRQAAFSFDTATAIAVDASGSAYVVGYTVATDFPVTPGAYQTVNAGPTYYEGFAAKFNPAGGLAYSTYLGGLAHDECTGVAVDGAGNAYVTGWTESNNFPTTPGAFQPTFLGARYIDSAAFVTKLNAAGTGLVYSTLVGSTTFPMAESAAGIAVNSAGEAYVVGITGSTHFPVTPDAIQPAYAGNDDAFLVKLNTVGSALNYGTYFGGGNGPELPSCVALDAAGNVYLAGNTTSLNLPVTSGAFQTTIGSSSYGDGFIAKIGTALSVSYSIGGRVTDGANGISGAMVVLSGSLRGTQWTDANGRYSFGNLPPGGDYTVTPQSPYYDFGSQRQTFTNLSANQTADFTGTIHRYRISGQIKDDGGNALSGVSLRLSNTQNGVSRLIQTDAAGNYSFADVPTSPGTYTLTPFKTHYAFNPSQRQFTNLTGDQTADFTGILNYAISGHLTDSATSKPILRVSVQLDAVIAGTNYRQTATTDDNGFYLFYGLLPVGVYTVTPINAAYAFAPPKQSFSNLSDDVTADFVGTYLLANIQGRVTDENGNGMYNVEVDLGGAANVSTRTDGSGNYTFYSLRKGNTFTVTPVKLGYSFTPASAAINLAGDTTQNFAATATPPRPFMPGNIITAASNLLGEYTPDGQLVQAVVIPYPRTDPNQVEYAGDLVLDKNGEVQIFNGNPPRLTSYDFAQHAWRQKSFDGWTSRITYNDESGIAAFGDYVFLDTYLCLCGDTRSGIIRVNINNYSSERFATDTQFVHLSLGQDGLIYGLVFGLNQVYAYDPVTMQRVRNITLTSNVHAVTANRAGDLFAVTRLGHILHFNGSGAVVKDISPGLQLQDIDISSDGRMVASGTQGVVFFDEGLNIIKTFSPPTGGIFVAFTKPASVGSIQVDSANYSTGEGDGRVTLTVTRTGDASSAASVSYATADNQAAVRCDDTTTMPGVAFSRCDYATAAGTLTFAPGETQKSFTVSIIDDAFVEGNETFAVRLSNPQGAVLGATPAATVTIRDNDTSAQPNPILSADFFVRQQYLDFLAREPEPGQPWSNVINNCAPNDASCDRVSVSANFFRSQEFQLKGLFVFKFYKVTYGRMPTYAEIVSDMSAVTGSTTAELIAKKDAFTSGWASRQAFHDAGLDALPNQTFVDTLMNRYNLQSITTINPASPDDANAQRVTLTRAALVTGLNASTLSRGQVVRAIADSTEVSNAEFNSAFVAMQYFGYLRRDPEAGGYNDWLRTINANPSDVRSMVNGFVNSTEYKLRFGQP